MKSGNKTLIMIFLLGGVISFLSQCGPALVKDPWDKTAQARYYQLDRITASTQAAEAFRKGCLDIEKKRYNQAVKHFTTAVQHDGDLWEAFFELGRAQQAVQDYDGALRNLEQAAMLAPDRENVRVELAATRNNASQYYYLEAEKAMHIGGLLTEVEKLYKKALNAYPKNLSVLIGLGKYYLLLKKPLLASHYFQTVLDLVPTQREAVINLAKIHIAAGNYLKAQTLLTEAAPYHPDDDDLTQLLSEVKHGLSKGEKPSELILIQEKLAITRADLAALILVILEPRTLSWKSLPSFNKPIIVLDISEHWAHNYIKTVLEYRIMKPFPNHTFKPDSPVSRYELAGIINTLLHKVTTIEAVSLDNTPEMALHDVPTEHTLYQAIQNVINLKLMNCDEQRKFFPHSKISGNHAIGILSNLKKLFF
ncbi:S-layer homology domain-containing protein [candidate division CSSED10-310 bacterium]|uniref:S-layer homology domain-containing protein n=1 Tax=candidate division CSSED10-310 bacterium TaxID=2855610 RepID=A0ABV6YZN7_UNCC1